MITLTSSSDCWQELHIHLIKVFRVPRMVDHIYRTCTKQVKQSEERVFSLLVPECICLIYLVTCIITTVINNTFLFLVLFHLVQHSLSHFKVIYITFTSIISILSIISFIYFYSAPVHVMNYTVPPHTE